MCHSSFNVFVKANLIFFSCNGLDSQPLRNFHDVQFEQKKYIFVSSVSRRKNLIKDKKDACSPLC